MMKRILCILMFAALIPAISAAQTPRKSQVSVGYGLFNTSDLADSFSDVIVTGLTGGVYASENNWSSGTLYANYSYSITDRIGVGGTYAYTRGKSDALVSGSKVGEFRNNFHTLAAEADYKYISTPKMKLYSAVGLGATLYSQKYEPSVGGNGASNSMVFFDFQLSFIGFRYGERMGGLIELGFGYKGIVNAGVFLRF